MIHQIVDLALPALEVVIHYSGLECVICLEVVGVD